MVDLLYSVLSDGGITGRDVVVGYGDYGRNGGLFDGSHGAGV